MFRAEICGCLVALQSIDKIFVDNDDSTKIKLCIASDCLRVIRKLEKESKVLIMSKKLQPIVREIISLKL